MLKTIASCRKFVQPSATANILGVADKRLTRLIQRELVSFVVAVVPSMSEKDIDIKIMISAISLRTGVKIMDP